MSSYKFASFIGAGIKFVIKIFLASDDSQVTEKLIPSLNETAEWRIRALIGPNKQTLYKAINANKYSIIEKLKVAFYIFTLGCLLVSLTFPALIIAIYQDFRKKPNG